MSRAIHVVLAAGGTAGHIEPALNLADALVHEEPDVVVTVIGGDHGLEASLVPSRGYALKTIPVVVMPRSVSRDLLTVGPKVIAATKQAVQHLQELRPDVVVGFGGYAALPTYRATRKLGYELVIHEANARAGLASSLVSFHRTLTHTGYALRLVLNLASGKKRFYPGLTGYWVKTRGRIPGPGGCLKTHP